MQGKVCLVTGANQGIGRVIAEDLARRGARVLITSRSAERGAATVAAIQAATGNPRVECLVADFAVQAEVRALVAEIHRVTDRLDVLVNNAGAHFHYRTITPDNHESTFAVNHLAPFILTNGVLDLLRESAPSRIVNISSEAHQRAVDIEDWESTKAYGGVRAYARSKLANVMFTYELAHRLEGTGVTANACHPGLVNTGLLEEGFNRWWTRWLWPIARRFTITPAEGAETPIYLATSPEVDGVTGKYFKNKRPATSSLVSHDATIGARLWNVSLRMTGELPEVEITGEHVAV